MEEKLDQRLQLMVTRSEMEEIDRWRFTHHVPSRSEAVRRMMRSVLDGHALHDNTLPEQPTTSEQPAQPAQPADFAHGLAELKALLLKERDMTEGESEVLNALMERLERLESGLSSVIRSEVERVMRSLPVSGSVESRAERPAVPALDPVAEEEAQRKIMGFAVRSRVKLPETEEARPPDGPEPTIEELQARAEQLRAQARRAPDFKPVPKVRPGEG